MRPLRALVIYLIIVFLGGALLAPWLYRLTRFAPSSIAYVAKAPLHRAELGAFGLLALVGFWPLRRRLGIASWRETGLVSPRGQWRKVAGGLGLGIAAVVLAAGFAFARTGRTLAHDLSPHKVTGVVFGALAAAAVAAVLEEILFRGGIFGGLRRTFYWPLALVASAAIYAFAHFLQHPDSTGPVLWYSGLGLLLRMLGGFGDIQALAPGFLNLVLAGMLLGLAYQRTGNLYFSIGLHAGWILCLKLYANLTAAGLRAATGFWGTDKLIDGWMACLALAATLALVKWLPLRPAREPFAITR